MDREIPVGDEQESPEEVDIIASGYEWECPSCEHLNLIAEYPCEQNVKCQKCGEEFTAALPEHCFD